MLRKLVRALVPIGLREQLYRVRKAADLDTPMILGPTYAEDGLISQHTTDFLADRAFVDAYAKARSGVHWTHPGEIRFRAYIATWAAQHALGLDGDFVECGVGHGIYSKTICHFVKFADFKTKRFFLYDTFQGIPLDTLKDAAEKERLSSYNDIHYSGDLLGEAKRGFAEFPNAVIVKGTVPDSLTRSAPEKVAYLSIDMNNATAEIAAIEFFWNRLILGAVVLLDDYAYGPEFLDQKRAWDLFCEKVNVPILTLPTGQGLILKR